MMITEVLRTVTDVHDTDLSKQSATTRPTESLLNARPLYPSLRPLNPNPHPFYRCPRLIIFIHAHSGYFIVYFIITIKNIKYHR